MICSKKDIFHNVNILFHKVVVGPDVTLNPGTMLSSQPQVNEWREEGEEPGNYKSIGRKKPLNQVVFVYR